MKIVYAFFIGLCGSGSYAIITHIAAVFDEKLKDS